MDWFCCTTGADFLDAWTLAHLAFWIFVGSTLWGLKANKWVSLGCCVAVALVWELFEYFIAFKYWPTHWLDPESWYNSLISDPLTAVIGVLGMWYLLDHRPRRK